MTIERVEPIIVSLEKELKQIKNRLVEAERALKFYADKDNWDYCGEDLAQIDLNADDRSKLGYDYYGGKRAREYFKKWG